MKTSAIVARVFAPIAAIVTGLFLLLVFVGTNPPLVRPSTVTLLFLYAVIIAILSGSYARWDAIAARIFAFVSCCAIFGPLAFLLVIYIERHWSKIYGNHLMLLCFYVLVGTASPLISLAFIRFVEIQSTSVDKRSSP